MVNRFRQHPSLQYPFANVHDWPARKEILTHFWWVTLGGKRYLDYSYQVASKHAEAGFTPALLADWLTLFHEIIQAEIPAELAAGWLERADRIGQSLADIHEVAQRRQPLQTALFKPA